MRTSCLKRMINMPRSRARCLRREVGQKPQPGDRIKVVGGNVCIGAVGILQDNYKVDFGNGNVTDIDLFRVIVLEIGSVPLGETFKKPEPPQPISHNYNQFKEALQQISSKQVKWKEPIVLEEEQEAKVEEELPPKPNKMEKKGERRRKKGAEWGF
jgi:hypothetical protein